ncbi:MAG TPA: HAMP domain-containing histidine kinase, partial [Gammaproteobacteria bacterium]|nr:HAMP domain-containing histidine kinase [Gammaproteobacteria bacterium]
AFTSDVSHELRTPLTVIRGATEVLLADTGLEPALRRRLERIARSAQEISELIEALLLLAREEQGQGVEASCKVEAVLRQVLDSHAHLLAHKPVDVRFEVDAPLRIAAQCTLLRVVLANLVRNAFSFTREGEVRVRLCRDGVTVEDTGSGIAEEDLQRVFDHFYRGEEGGAGIGLSLVRRICDRHGWTLELDSEEGRGTRVRLLFDHPERADDTA